jgi:hypothetical protein
MRRDTFSSRFCRNGDGLRRDNRRSTHWTPFAGMTKPGGRLHFRVWHHFEEPPLLSLPTAITRRPLLRSTHEIQSRATLSRLRQRVSLQVLKVIVVAADYVD